eukprot:IDg2069t1
MDTRAGSAVYASRKKRGKAPLLHRVNLPVAGNIALHTCTEINAYAGCREMCAAAGCAMLPGLLCDKQLRHSRAGNTVKATLLIYDGNVPNGAHELRADMRWSPPLCACIRLRGAVAVLCARFIRRATYIHLRACAFSD